MPDEVGVYGVPDEGAATLERAGMLDANKEPEYRPAPEPKGNGKAAPAGFERYLIVTVNPNYTGQVFGVQINRGVGLLDPTSVNHKMGRTMQDIVLDLRSMGGYTVTPLEGDVVAAIQKVREQQDADEAGAIELVRTLVGLGSEKFAEILAAARHG